MKEISSYLIFNECGTCLSACHLWPPIELPACLFPPAFLPVWACDYLADHHLPSFPHAYLSHCLFALRPLRDFPPTYPCGCVLVCSCAYLFVCLAVFLSVPSCPYDFLPVCLPVPPSAVPPTCLRGYMLVCLIACLTDSLFALSDSRGACAQFDMLWHLKVSKLECWNPSTPVCLNISAVSFASRKAYLTLVTKVCLKKSIFASSGLTSIWGGG